MNHLKRCLETEMLKLLVLFFVLVNIWGIDCQNHIGYDQQDVIPLRRKFYKLSDCDPYVKVDGIDNCKPKPGRTPLPINL